MQICINTQGSFKCECYTGYTMESNGAECLGEIQFYVCFLKGTLHNLFVC